MNEALAVDLMSEHTQKAGAWLEITRNQETDDQSPYFHHGWAFSLPELEVGPESPLSSASSLDSSPLTIPEDHPTSLATTPNFWRPTAPVLADPIPASAETTPAFSSKLDAEKLFALAPTMSAISDQADRLSRWDRARRLHQRPTLRSFEHLPRYIKERSRKRRRTFTGDETRPLVGIEPSDPAEILEATQKYRSWDIVS